MVHIKKKIYSFYSAFLDNDSSSLLRTKILRVITELIFFSPHIQFSNQVIIFSNRSIIWRSFQCVVVVQLLSHVHSLQPPWTAVHQTSLSFTMDKLMSIRSVMLSNQLILCHPVLLLPSIFPSISVFSNESALHIK